MRIAYNEIEPFLLGDADGQVVLVDIIGYHPIVGSMRVGDTFWATGTGVLDGVERGFLAYHATPAKPSVATSAFGRAPSQEAEPEVVVATVVVDPAPALAPHELPRVPETILPMQDIVEPPEPPRVTRSRARTLTPENQPPPVIL